VYTEIGTSTGAHGGFIPECSKLDELEHSWAAHRSVRFSDPDLCPKEYCTQDLDFEDPLAKVDIVVQSSQVSRELSLFYADPLLR
jgi:hypothetical protein